MTEKDKGIMEARGVVPWKKGDPLPEDLIQAARGNFEPLYRHLEKEYIRLLSLTETKDKQLAEAYFSGWRDAVSNIANEIDSPPPTRELMSLLVYVVGLDDRGYNPDGEKIIIEDSRAIMEKHYQEWLQEQRKAENIN